MIVHNAAIAIRVGLWYNIYVFYKIPERISYLMAKKTSTNSAPPWSAEFSTVFGITCGFTRRRIVSGGVVTALLLALVLVHTNEFLMQGVECGALLYALSLFAVPLIGFIAACRFSTTRAVTGKIANTTLIVLLPIVAMTMVECLNGVFTWDWTPLTLLLNYVLYWMLYGVVYVFSGSIRAAMISVHSLVFLLGLTNHYVYTMRGTPFIPMDLFAAGTAANVAGSYDFSFNYQIIVAIVLLFFAHIVAYKIHTPCFGITGKIAVRTFFVTLDVTVVCLYLFTNLYANAGLKPDFWNQARGYRYSGVVLNFMLNTKYVHLGEPSNYNAADVPAIIDGVLATSDTAADIGVTPDSKQPHVICIMNESLSDIAALGDVKTNIDYMPYLHSLTENTVRGNLYVPVIGAGTSNTEFEFLSGASTSFFPAGSNAYMLYVDDPLQSLVSTLMGQGYSSRAFHPYYASGWNRPAVYENMGFSNTTFLEHIIDVSLLRRYAETGDEALFEQIVEEAYPGQNVLLRRYVSDSYNYEKVIEMYEQRDTSQPFFLFNVTMQNHGGYGTQSQNFQQEVYIVDENGQIATTVNSDGKTVAKYPKANQYLSLMKRSDDAFRELTAYFEAQDEPVIICMFGDHQPNLEKEYLHELLGVSSTLNLSVEQTQKQYVTPFYIWANYDIEEQEIERLSVNYLSSYMLKAAGVQMPAYNRYLLALSETLPVINNVGHIDAEGNHYAAGDNNSPYLDLLDGYEKVIYNLVFDEENRQDAYYSVG